MEIDKKNIDDKFNDQSRSDLEKKTDFEGMDKSNDLGYEGVGKNEKGNYKDMPNKDMPNRDMPNNDTKSPDYGKNNQNYQK